METSKQFRMPLLIFISMPVLMGCGDDQEMEYAENMCSISCPEGVVCDGNFDYRAYMCKKDNILIYISFNPKIVSNYSLSNFEQYFNYYNLWIYFPERDTRKKKVYYINRDPILDSPIVDYADGIIRLRISGVIDKITTEISRKKNCQSGDVTGICYEVEEANIPYDYTLLFEVEE